MMEQQPKWRKDEAAQPRYDLSEEASKRPEGDAATTEARMQESDDINANTGSGLTDRPYDDMFGENKVSTSLDDE